MGDIVNILSCLNVSFMLRKEGAKKVEKEGPQRAKPLIKMGPSAPSKEIREEIDQ